MSDILPEKYKKISETVDALQLTWASWNAICDFVPVPAGGKGCYLDNQGEPLPEGQTSDRIGLFLFHPGSGLDRSIKAIVRQDDWVVRDTQGVVYCLPDSLFKKIYEPVQGVK
jgi:hypothetical protein